METVEMEFDEVIMTSGLLDGNLPSIGTNEDNTGVGDYGNENGEW